MEVAADLAETGDRTRQKLGISGRAKPGSPFEERETEEIVQVGPVDDPCGPLVVERASERLGYRSSVLTADRRDVQTPDAKACQQVEMLQFQAAPDGKLVQANQMSLVNLHRSGSKGMLLSPILFHRVQIRR